MNTSNSNTNWYVMGAIPIPMEDPITHTAENGYLCSDTDCICHSEHEQAIRDQLAHEDEARREWFFRVPMDGEQA